MVKKLTASQENYLELILGLSQHGPIRIRDIADAGGVRLPSVTRAITQLAKAGLVRHESYGTVEITQLGLEAARSVVRRDDCLSRLLTEVLLLPEDDVAAEVCRMEHVLGHDVLLRLEILVEHACGKRSAKWLGELQEKLDSLSPEQRDIIVGNADPHVALHKPSTRKKTKLKKNLITVCKNTRQDISNAFFHAFSSTTSRNHLYHRRGVPPADTTQLTLVCHKIYETFGL